MQKNKGARAQGSVRPRSTLWSTIGGPHYRCSITSTMGGSHGCRRRCRRRCHRPPVKPSPPPDAVVDAAPADSHLVPSNVAIKGSFIPPEPTMAEHPDGPSKPFITTETTSTFQIRRGRKPTMITMATRGKFSSPVINKPIFIPLRSSPIFRSKPSHLLIHIFMDHFIDFDPRMDNHSSGSNRFLPELISPSVFPKSICHQSRGWRGLDRMIQAVDSGSGAHARGWPAAPMKPTNITPPPVSAGRA
ncbi:hypothetical protein ACLOJK_025938 [Asimina triloba]